MTTVSTDINEACPHICVGIDIGKASHVAGVVSQTLLSEKRRYDKCPTFSFDNSREGFTALMTFLQVYGPLHSLAVLVEVTGHYHRLLVDYLCAHGISCYLVATNTRGEIKTDQQDALRLAHFLHRFLMQHEQPGEREIRPAPTLAPEIATLVRLMRHRYELVQDLTRRKNRLTALCDELFPELTQVCHNPNSQFALALRERFPTAAQVAEASLDDVKACRAWSRPSEAGLLKLHMLARSSIGCTDPGRVAGLRIEQAQVITQVRLLSTQIESLEAEITRLVTQTRAGQIVMSIDGIGALHAAHIVATIGDIRRFDSVAQLRKYFGWSPIKAQSGSTLDAERERHRRGGLAKRILFLVALSAITRDTVWRQLYDRLVPRMCHYDGRRGRYIGKMRVIGRVCGQMISVIHVLLKADADKLSSLPPGEPPPEPQLYDRDRHLASLNRRHPTTAE